MVARHISHLIVRTNWEFERYANVEILELIYVYIVICQTEECPMRIMNAHRLTIFQGVKTEVAGFETEPNEESMEHAQTCGSMPCGCARESRCRGGFLLCSWPLQSVQRAEMCGVILALQSSGACHLGVDNLGVVRHVGRLLDGRPGSVPFKLVNDGDLLLLLGRVLHLRGLDTVRVTKVNGHADEGMVLDGRVWEFDRIGNNAADEAADSGRRRVGNAGIDARRNLSGVCGRWYPVLLDFRRFFIASSRAVVIHDGRDGTAPDPMVWSASAHPKKRRLVHAVRDCAFLPGPPRVWDSEWVHVPASAHLR